MIYVDCDSTLILYDGTHDSVTGAEGWRPNDHLVWCLNWYLEMYPQGVTVWSGGGGGGSLSGDYAGQRARDAKLEQPPRYYTRSKDPALPTPWDIVIDDELEFTTKAKLLTPEEAVIWFLEVGLTPAWAETI